MLSSDFCLGFVAFFELLYASIVSRISAKLGFLMSSLAFLFMVFTYSYIYMISMVVLAIISLRFVIRALIGDDILGFSVNCSDLLCS